MISDDHRGRGPEVALMLPGETRRNINYSHETSLVDQRILPKSLDEITQHEVTGRIVHRG